MSMRGAAGDGGSLLNSTALMARPPHGGDGPLRMIG